MDDSPSRRRCIPSGKYLGAIAFAQMDNIESLFATIADLVDPWGNVVNPLWAAFLERLEGAESSAGPVFLPLFILTPAQLNTWRAHLVGYGNDEQQYCYDFQIFLKQIRCQTTLTNSE